MKDNSTTLERSKSGKSTNGGTGFGWWSNGTQTMEGLARSNASLMQGAFGIAQEMLAFSQMRLRANIDAWSALAACRDPEELIKLQQSFTQSATTDCLNEANKVATQMADLLCGAAKCFGDQSART
ncbi:MAG TPA: phasin family protein [Stellaceae bacterium]|nr:phasin family protein [Stellaceae bacterium]